MTSISTTECPPITRAEAPARPEPRLSDPERPSADLSAKGPAATLGEGIFHLHRITDLGIGLLLLLIVLALPRSGAPTSLPAMLTTGVALRDVLVLVGAIVVWQSGLLLAGIYSMEGLESRRTEVGGVLTATAIGGIAAGMLAPPAPGPVSPIYVALATWVIGAAATLGARWGVRALFRSAAATGQPRVLIVGSGPRAVRLYHELTTQGYDVLGLVDAETPVRPGEAEPLMLGTLERLEHLLMTNAVDEVMITLPVRSCYERIQIVIETCQRMGVKSRYLADVFRTVRGTPRLEATVGHSMISVDVVRSERHRALKRTLDIVGSLVALIALAPLMTAIALGIKLTSPGPVLFAQDRYGLNRRRFRMFKFRTMVADAERRQTDLEHLNESAGPTFKIRMDPRITRFGRMLRRSSLDELPQLFNILRGEMSLVGPRPLPGRDVQRFPEAWLMRRFSVRPGLTGLWQVSGRSDLPFEDWIDLDLRYIDAWSLEMDLRILARTVPAVFSGKGAA